LPKTLSRFCPTALMLVLCFTANSAMIVSGVAADDVRKVDEFTGPGWESAMAHLDNFAAEMGNNPNATAVVMVYGRSHGKRGEARAWLACIKDYLVKRREMPAERLIMIDAGYRTELTAGLFLTNDRKHLPAKSGQIEPRHVKLQPGKVSDWRRMCSN
jgi:hypothetical protein